MKCVLITGPRTYILPTDKVDTTVGKMKKVNTFNYTLVMFTRVELQAMC